MSDQRLSASTVRSLVSQYPDWDPESMVRIAWRESNFVPTAFADDSDDLSYGLFQINMKEGTANIPQLRQMYGITRNEELFNPVVNVRAAHVLWQTSKQQTGNGYKPWNVVPAVKNYPDTGGSTTVPTTDDQGSPQWQGNDDSSADPMDWTSSKLQSEAQRIYTAAGREGYLAEFYARASLAQWAAFVAALSAADQKVMNAWKRYQDGVPVNNDPHSNESGGGWNDLLDIPGAALDFLTPDWAAGLGKLLSVLTSLSFWKKVGVGFLALLLIIGAVMIFNKDKALPIITKGAVSG